MKYLSILMCLCLIVSCSVEETQDDSLDLEAVASTTLPGIIPLDTVPPKILGTTVRETIGPNCDIYSIYASSTKVRGYARDVTLTITAGVNNTFSLIEGYTLRIPANVKVSNNISPILSDLPVALSNPKIVVTRVERVDTGNLDTDYLPLLQDAVGGCVAYVPGNDDFTRFLPNLGDDDFDNDGIKNNNDSDDDNDGIPDTNDPDDDNDGTDDANDSDDDNDGLPDVVDNN